MRAMDKRHLTKRDGIWHYARRVPTSLKEIDGRTVIKITTGVRVADDPRGVTAAKKAAIINGQVEQLWRDKIAGRSEDGQARYDAARSQARMWGFDYLTAEDVATRPIGEVLRRVGVAKLAADDSLAVPLMGGIEAPKIMLSGLFAVYEVIASTENRGMSADQIRRWRAPRVKAIRNLQNLIGDKPIAEITRGDALAFQDWWRDRILGEDMDIGTGNRDIGQLAKMLKDVDRKHRLGLDLAFNDLRIPGERDKSRIAFPIAFVRDRIMAEGALDAMNEEQRRIVYLIAETGLRLSEACNLTRETIILDGPVPHVQVRENGRRLKTEQSKRDIPLVGAALMAMRAQPDGFPRYRDKSTNLSNVANKALDAQGLRPTPDHTLYGLRHTFEDRMTAIEAPEKVAAALMGHKYHRPKYGSGPSLEQKLEWLQRMAFRPPSRV